MYIVYIQDEANPDFVSEMVELYFEDSASKIEKLAGLLSGAAIDFTQVDQLVHQFKGSSASFGAHGMATACVQLRDACHAHQTATCQDLCSQLQNIFAALKGKLDQFLELEQRRKQLQGAP
jgi:histidine-containing phosphotransfer peotein